MHYIVQTRFPVSVHTLTTEYAISPSFLRRFPFCFLELVAIIQYYLIALTSLLSSTLGLGHVLISPGNGTLLSPPTVSLWICEWYRLEAPEITSSTHFES